jgi:MFS family permease
VKGGAHTPIPASGSVWRRIPAPIWALGFTSLLMDMASEAVHAFLPVFMVGVLGASPAILGLMEGVAEGLSSITKLFSGAISDRLRAHKALTIVGYSLGAISKPLFAIAPTVGWVFVARTVDRFGKGIRGAPRDALVAEYAPAEVRGAAFGLRQSLDTVGAILGPLAAMGVLLWFEMGIRVVFLLATIPAVLAVLVLWMGVKKRREGYDILEKSPRQWPWQGGAKLPAAFWAVVVVGAMLTMARFSEAFLVLQAQDEGFQLAFLPLVLVIMNVVYAAVSYPAGVLSDRMAAYKLLALGCLVLLAADLVLAYGASLSWTVLGIALWGLHMGLTQGVLAALVAAAAPAPIRATAFGLFNLVMGIVMVVSSALAGVLWQDHGAQATFMAGGIFSLLAVVGAVAVGPRLPGGEKSQAGQAVT